MTKKIYEAQYKDCWSPDSAEYLSNINAYMELMVVLFQMMNGICSQIKKLLSKMKNKQH